MKPTIKHVQMALKTYSRTHSQAAMRNLLLTVGGVATVEQLPGSKFEAVITAAESGKLFTSESANAAARWKEIETATKHGHARIYGAKTSE